MLKWPDSRWRRSIQPMPFRVGQCGQKVLIIQSWKTASFTITTRRGHYFNIPKFRNIAIEISCTMGLWVIRIYKYCNLHCNLSILEGYISIIRQPEHMTSGHKNQGLFRVFVTLDIQSPPGIWTPKTYLKHPLLVILCDPFGMVKTWPFQWPSDLQIKIGDQKVASAGKKTVWHLNGEIYSTSNIPKRGLKLETPLQNSVFYRLLPFCSREIIQKRKFSKHTSPQPKKLDLPGPERNYIDPSPWKHQSDPTKNGSNQPRKRLETSWKHRQAIAWLPGWQKVDIKNGKTIKGCLPFPSSSSSLHVYTWYIDNWEFGSKYIGNWKIRVFQMTSPAIKIEHPATQFWNVFSTSGCGSIKIKRSPRQRMVLVVSGIFQSPAAPSPPWITAKGLILNVWRMFMIFKTNP